jgi:hypothetical protein
MPLPFLDTILSSNPTPINNKVVRGSLITFNYSLRKPGHDAFPLVLVTDIDYPAKNPIAKPGYNPGYKQGDFIRGINLHYLTFPTIKKLIFPNNQSICENSGFTYQYIKANNYIVSAFRQYRKVGIRNLKKLDCQFVAKAMSISRSFDPNEIEAIRKSVRDQLSRIVNPTALDMGQKQI